MVGVHVCVPTARGTGLAALTPDACATQTRFCWYFVLFGRVCWSPFSPLSSLVWEARVFEQNTEVPLWKAIMLDPRIDGVHHKSVSGSD